MLATFLSERAYLFVLVFARLGAAIMVMPAFGESSVVPRVRLALAIGLTIVLMPVVETKLPSPAPAFPMLLLLVGTEVLIGLVIGAMARFLITALQVAGTIIAFNTGLGSAQLFDPTAQQQGAITGALMSTFGVLMIFAANLHHLMLRALADSYDVFQPGRPLPVGDFSDLAANLVARSFSLGFRIALPVIAVSLVVYLGMGLVSRLMPQIQIFFVALPIQLLFGYLMLALTIGTGLLLFVGEFQTGMALFTAPK